MHTNTQYDFTCDEDYKFDLCEREAAEILGVDPQTVRNRRLSGKIPEYLYRVRHTKKTKRHRYNRILLVRWSLLIQKNIEAERQWAIARIKDRENHLAKYGVPTKKK